MSAAVDPRIPQSFAVFTCAAFSKKLTPRASALLLRRPAHRDDNKATALAAALLVQSRLDAHQAVTEVQEDEGGRREEGRGGREDGWGEE